MSNYSSRVKEIQRMSERMRAMALKDYCKPYEGRTDDIDIVNQELFCPNCGYDKPLKLNRDKTAVSCANPVKLGIFGEYCEYEYKLTHQRILDDTFWTSGFEYPKTKREVLEGRLSGRTKRLNELPALRQEAIEQFNQEERELTEQIASIQIELDKIK